MNMPKQVAILVTILILLMTQISSVYAYANASSMVSDIPCAMNVDHTETHSMHSMNNAQSNMDCCDSDDKSMCCEGQCECMAVSTTVLFLPSDFLAATPANQNEVFIDLAPLLHSAYSSLLIRPPIFS
jgi:hypothetical protein